jgi:hypothetical protein
MRIRIRVSFITSSLSDKCQQEKEDSVVTILYGPEYIRFRCVRQASQVILTKVPWVGQDRKVKDTIGSFGASSSPGE